MSCAGQRLIDAFDRRWLKWPRPLPDSRRSTSFDRRLLR